jgi:hypothetical protein
MLVASKLHLLRYFFVFTGAASYASTAATFRDSFSTAVSTLRNMTVAPVTAAPLGSTKLEQHTIWLMSEPLAQSTRP